MPAAGEQHPWMTDGHRPYVWSPEHGTYVPESFYSETAATPPPSVSPVVAPEDRQQYGPSIAQAFGYTGPIANTPTTMNNAVYSPPPASTTTTTTPPPAPAPRVILPNQRYQRPTTDANAGPSGLVDIFDEHGNINDYYVPRIDLGEPAEVSGTFSGQEESDYFTRMNNLAAQVQQQYGGPIPDFQAAQIALGNVPQSQATSMSISPELQRMMSGEGFSPQLMAGMRSRAIEDAARAGRSELSQAKIAMQQAGIGGSPAGAGIAADVARRSGQAQTAALRDIDIESALQAIQNQQFGIGQQTQIGLSNMQIANQMALANANRLFDAMNTNVANQQQVNATRFGAQENRNLRQADATSNVVAQQGGAFQQAALGRSIDADQTNAANRTNQQINQAQLDRQQQLANQQARNMQWQTGASILGGYAPNPGMPTASPGFSPLGATFSGFGSDLIRNSNIRWGNNSDANSPATT